MTNIDRAYSEVTANKTTLMTKVNPAYGNRDTDVTTTDVTTTDATTTDAATTDATTTTAAAVYDTVAI